MPNASSTLAKPRVPTTMNRVSCEIWRNCVRPPLPAPGWSRHCSRREISICSSRDYDKAIDSYRELQQRFPNAEPCFLCALEGSVAESAPGQERRGQSRIRAADRPVSRPPPKFPRHCIGGPAWLRKTTTLPSPAPITRSCQSAFAIFTTANWRGAGCRRSNLHEDPPHLGIAGSSARR